jgi:hypothetical protein
LGIGDWAQSPIPNPQSPIPNPHEIFPFNKIIKNYSFLIFKLFKIRAIIYFYTFIIYNFICIKIEALFLNEYFTPFLFFV